MSTNLCACLANRLSRPIAAVLLLLLGCCNSGTTKPSPVGDQSPCPNGVRAGAEQCDGHDLGQQGCGSLGYPDGGTLACSNSCGFDVSQCLGAGPECGNGITEGLEECDGPDLRRLTCRLLGYASATTDPLACRSDCAFDTSACTGAAPSCGNDNAEGLEQCDGFDLRGRRCTDFGFTGGLLECDEGCRFVVGACVGGSATYCGDGIRNGSEECDGTDLGQRTCAALGYTGTGLKCASTCRFDASACTGAGPVCGDNIRQGVEECDGVSNNVRCSAFGLTGGAVPCDASCTADPSVCDPPHCGDGAIDQAGELCDGADVGGDTCEKHGYAGGELQCNASCGRVVFSGCTGGTPACGNGLVEPEEMCDQRDLGIYDDCRSVDSDLGGGALSCLSNCLVDFSACIASVAGTCGNGIFEEGEQCDGPTATACAQHDLGTGTITCNPNCTLNLAGCVR
ncbi:MAG: hypothetical protein HY903_22880 [Deltaproteobacteria bacterium]|nr:hypothetical protein [Deltaproteobacteria bacterium]